MTTTVVHRCTHVSTQNMNLRIQQRAPLQTPPAPPYPLSADAARDEQLPFLPRPAAARVSRRLVSGTQLFHPVISAS